MKDLRARRIAAGIAAELVALKAGLERGRYSRIERELINASAGELQRINAAIDELARVKQDIEKYAVIAGWPAVVGL